MALGFLALIIVGSLLLLLPFASHQPISLMDALFTATSAVTVTGLVVVNTGTDYTMFGQTVIAILIQFGGLGLMTFAVVTLITIGGKVGIINQQVAAADFNQTNFSTLKSTAKSVLIFALLVESAGMLVLFARWYGEMPFGDALFHSFFYAISAFNNAGFALSADSLMSFVGDPVINIIITGMFIAGGLGFVVWIDLYKERRWNKLGIYTRAMIVSTVIINVAAMLIFLALEWKNPATLAGLDIGEKLWASWFQATTPRTAGFNTIDTSGYNDGTTVLTILLMFIGGGSMSTASGIKLMTFVVLILSTYSFLRKRPEIRFLNRSVPEDTVRKAFAIAVLSLALIWSCLFLLTSTHSISFLDAVFEVVSAFGTVGLSRGATSELNMFGQLLIMFLMFFGRIGPLTLGYLLATPTISRIRHPKVNIAVG